MSYSELKAFDKDGNARVLEKFNNSHYIQIIWHILAEKYGVIEKLKREVARAQGTPEHLMDQIVQGDRGVYYEALGRLHRDMSPVWDLQHNPALSREDWYVLMFTFDNMVVPPELIERVAQAFESIKVEAGVINHGAGFARCMRTAVKEIEGLRGITLHNTSICEDPWWIYQADETGRPYNLNRDDDHHLMPTREAHRKMEEGA